MAGRITALEPQKRSKRRFNIYLEGEFAFGLADMEAARLQVGDWLTDEDIETLQAADTLAQAKDKALNYLSYRPRSEWEIQGYLIRRDFDEVVIDQALERLRELELVDDQAFARFWIDHRTQFRPRAQRALRYELQQKGLTAAIIDAALEDYDEHIAAEKLAQQLANKLSNLPPDQRKKRLIERMARRGFSYTLIRDVIAAQLSPQTNFTESEED